MTQVATQIMSRIKAKKDAVTAFTPKDFIDLGSRAAVDQALTRLVKSGSLRRIGRGLYDRPRHSNVLQGDAPPSVDAVAAAVARRAGGAILKDNLAAANALGLTTAVPSRPVYLASRAVKDILLQGRRIQFGRIGAALMPWVNSDAAPIVQALLWARSSGTPLDQAAVTIARHASKKAKTALGQNLRLLPNWALASAKQIAANHATSGA